ncbi:MAG: ABC transporter permease [Chloroflexota bacterium]|nr:ABC transporter permease [Chloroflexota bacterium]
MSGVEDSHIPAETVADDGDRRFDWQRLWPLASLGTLLVVGGIWWLLTSGLSIVKPLYFPAPVEVINSLIRLGPSLLADGMATLMRVVVSWMLGSALGVLAGLVMVRSRIAYFILTPIVEALRPVPPVALIPFVILWFGIGDSGKIFLAALGCFMVMAINTIVAADNVAPVYLRAARSLGATQNQVYRTIILPAIGPQLVGGLRIGAALAFAIVVAAEFLGAKNGIGTLIMLASRTLNTPVVLLGTIVIGLEAFFLERVIRWFSLRLTSWAERSTD